jgi:Tol biopolymer transport system component/predicted Ser/Thr protein kinase
MSEPIGLRYVLGECIGKGGMGEVFLARDVRLERQVAVKVLPQVALADPDARKRLREEALALSRVNHPNIAAVYDYEHQDDHDLLVMEYVPGETLSDAIARERWSLARFYDAAIQLCDGLAAAHRAGVLHRDLKPGNVRVTPEGRIKILDFGLAKLIPSGSRVSPSQMSTATVSLVGTPAYISPEQLEGAPATPASDQFGLGLVLYEMLAARHPFGGPTPAATQVRIAHEPPQPLRKLRADVPPVLEQVIIRMLAKRPEERFADIGSVSAALKRAQEHPSTAIRPRFPRGGRMAALAAAIVAVLSLALYLRSPAEIYPTPAANGIVKQVTFSGNAMVPSWSPDGRYIAFAQGGKITVMPAEGGGVRSIALPFRVTVWGWMPGGDVVLVYGIDSTTSRFNSYAVNVLSGSASLLVTDGRFPAVSPDGRTLAYARGWGNEEIWLLDLRTGKSRVLLKPPRPGDAVYKPKWSPDGRRIGYMRWRGEAPGHDLWIMNADGTDGRMIQTAPIELGGQYSWTPDGKWVVIAGELQGVLSVWKISLEGREHQRLTAGSANERHVSLAPDGQRFVYQTEYESSRITVLDLVTGAIAAPLDVTARTRRPVFSADGTSLFFESLVQGRWQLWRARLGAGADLDPIVAIRGTSAFEPCPGKDGTILYIRADVGRVYRFGDIRWSQTIWRTSEDGGRQEQVLGPPEIVSRLAPTGERDGNLLYSVHDHGEGLRVRIGQAAPVTVYQDSTAEELRAFDWGPGNRQVLVSLAPYWKGGLPSAVVALDAETRKTETWLEPEDIAKVVPGAERSAVSWLCTSPNRRQVAMILPQSNPMAAHVLIYDVSSRRLRVLQTFEGRERPTSCAWSPDGKHLVVNLVKAGSDIFTWEPTQLAANPR